MNEKAHEYLGAGCWAVGSLVMDLAAQHFGHPGPVGPVAVVLGLPLAGSFAAGRNSPDVDRLWAPGLPRPGYHWAGHRGFTHRVWFACVVTILFTFGYFALASTVPKDVATIAFAPAIGWWSHLLGDVIKGRLKIGKRKVGLGL